MTDKTPEQQFAEALADFQSAMPDVSKLATGQAGTRTTKYADLAHMTEQAFPKLADNGLAYTAAPTLTDDGRFVLRYALLHKGGHREEGHYPLPSDANAQQMGSAISYARRYCLMAVTGIAPKDDDDDGKSASEVQTTVLPRAPRRRNATERHNGPDDPTTHVDEWTTRTDTAWTADFRSRLAACPSVPEARGLWAEIAAVQREGRCTTDDAELLHAEVTARVEALQEEGVSA